MKEDFNFKKHFWINDNDLKQYDTLVKIEQIWSHKCLNK